MSMVTSGILFAINTTGGGKAKLQFMAVAAGVAIAAKAFVSFAKNAQELHQAFSVLTDVQRFNLVELEKLNKGMIDTGASVKVLAGFAKAGMDDVSGLTKAMTKLVIDEGHKMGKTAEQMTADFTRLGEGIAKGSGRQLKTFGIDLQETEDLLLMQEEAIEKVIDRAAGLTVELKTLEQQTFAAKNSWETYTSLLWGSIGKSGTLTKLTEGLDASSEAMILAGDNTRMLAEADVVAQLAGAKLQQSLLGQANMAEFYDIKLQRLLGSMRRVVEMDATIEKFTAGVSLAGGGFEETAWMDPEDVSVDLGAFEAQKTKAKSFQKAAKKPKRGGGGGRAAATDMFSAAEMRAAEATWAFNEAMTVSNEIVGERNTKLQEVALTNEQQWAIDVQRDEETRLLESEYHEWSMINDDYYREQYLIKEQEKADKDLEIAKRLRDAKIGYAMQMSQGVGNLIMGLASMEKIETKRQFEKQKKAAYAQTVINTAAAAVAAFRGTVQVIPGPWGIAAGIAAAGLATALGAVQLATISKTEFEDTGGGVAAPSGGGAGYLGGGGGGGGNMGGVDAGQTTNVTIIMGEEKFQEFVWSANKQASQQGNPAFASEDEAA